VFAAAMVAVATLPARMKIGVVFAGMDYCKF
jgi:hypothetical protein